jgi:hypothetical protein
MPVLPRGFVMALRHAVVSTGIPSLLDFRNVNICNVVELGGQFISTPVFGDMSVMTSQLCGKYALYGTQAAGGEDLVLNYIVG